jgi:hypothetical protein
MDAVHMTPYVAGGEHAHVRSRTTAATKHTSAALKKLRMPIGMAWSS